MRWLSLFLVCQLKSVKNLREFEDQSWFKVQVVPLFHFNWYKMFRMSPKMYSPTAVCRPLSYIIHMPVVRYTNTHNTTEEQPLHYGIKQCTDGTTYWKTWATIRKYNTWWWRQRAKHVVWCKKIFNFENSFTDRCVACKMVEPVTFAKKNRGF
jgi:hypothetical protein